MIPYTQQLCCSGNQEPSSSQIHWTTDQNSFPAPFFHGLFHTTSLKSHTQHYPWHDSSILQLRLQQFMALGLPLSKVQNTSQPASLVKTSLNLVLLIEEKTNQPQKITQSLDVTFAPLGSMLYIKQDMLSCSVKKYFPLFSLFKNCYSINLVQLLKSQLQIQSNQCRHLPW